MFHIYVQVYFHLAPAITLYVSPNNLIATKSQNCSCTTASYSDVCLPPQGLKVLISRVSFVSEGGLHVGPSDGRFESESTSFAAQENRLLEKKK